MPKKHTDETKIKIGLGLRRAFLLKKTERWREDIDYKFNPYNINFNKFLKKQIRSRDNYCCRICGKTEKQNIKKLSIHHIDYNKKNSNPYNLITLCRRCHSKTTHNRDKWLNYFENLLCAKPPQTKHLNNLMFKE